MTFTASEYHDYYQLSRCDLRVYLRAKGMSAAEPDAYHELLAKLGQRHELRHLAGLSDYFDACHVHCFILPDRNDRADFFGPLRRAHEEVLVDFFCLKPDGHDVHIGILATSALSSYHPGYRVYEVPFLFEDLGAVRRFQRSKTGLEMLQLLQNSGLKGLAYLHGTTRVLSSVKPILFPTDLKGITLVEPPLNWEQRSSHDRVQIGLPLLVKALRTESTQRLSSCRSLIS